MAKQMPPNPVGPVSRFPYDILWEEFGMLWDNLQTSEAEIERFEALQRTSSETKGFPRRRTSKQAIAKILEKLDLDAQEHEALTEKMYSLAAVYLIPRLRRELGHTPKAFEKCLRVLAKQAADFSAALRLFDIEQEVILGLFRPFADSPASSRAIFDFKTLIIEAEDLAKAATFYAGEIPKWPRGTTVDVLLARWIRSSTRALAEAVGDRIEVLQADSAGRNPRPKGAPAEVLFAYLNLVDPGIADQTKVQQILAAQRPCWTLLHDMRSKSPLG